MSSFIAAKIAFYFVGSIMYVFIAIAFRKERIVVAIVSGTAGLYLMAAITEALAAYGRYQGWAP